MDAPPLPRFIFVHRVGIKGLELVKVPEYMAAIAAQLRTDKIPVVEFFIPTNDDVNYSLSIVDLQTFNKVEV